MARNEDGEFELVLGNRQLLSVFFILVVLLGVFFTMGYIVGRNNPNSDMVASNDGRKPIDANAPPVKPPIVVNPSDTEKPPEKQVPVDPPKIEKLEPVKPEVRTPDPPVKTPDPPKPDRPKVEVKKPEPKKPEPVKAMPPPVRTGEPAPGTYIQVVSVDKAGGEAIAETLRKKGFPTMVAPGASEKLFRVLVGPLNGPDAISKARTDLEGVGFKGAFVKKY